jgi:hypothetical protein
VKPAKGDESYHKVDSLEARSGESAEKGNIMNLIFRLTSLFSGLLKNIEGNFSF